MSPREALDSAEALLIQQGYEITQRTETSVTGVRRKREGMFTYALVDLTVEALPQPQSGVQIKLRGNDRRGVQARQAEWSRWNESLPKLEKGQQVREQPVQGASSPETRGTRTEEQTSEMREGSKVRNDLSKSYQGQEPVASGARDPETQAEVTSSEGERNTSPNEPGRWATVASWNQEPRVAAGKQEAEPPPSPENPPLERTSVEGTKQSADEQEQRDSPTSDATIPKVVEAESFRLVNEKGEPRAILGVREDAPYLTLKGTNGKDRILFSIGSEDDSATFALHDSNGNIRVFLGLRPDGSTTLALTDDAGQIRATLSVSMQASAEGVSPSLDFIDENGEVRFKIMQYEGKEPTIVFVNEQGETSMILREQDGKPNLGLLDKFGTTRGVFALASDGSPALIIQDERGREIRRLP